MGALIQIQLGEAIHAYETGGPAALRLALIRFQLNGGSEGVLTDGTGRDLVTGEDRSELVMSIRQQRLRMPLMKQDRAIIARMSADGEYVFFALLDRSNMVTWFVQPQLHLIILTLLALLCYLFARHLTNPVRNLRRAVDRFGRGDFSSRAYVNRGDEIGQLSKSFNEMADRIQTLLTAERRLLQDISHELRSPLARISVAIELVRMGEDVESHVARIQREADRLNALVGELLQVTRVEGDVSQLRAETIDLERLAREVVDDGQLEAEARGINVTLHSEPVTYKGDPELLRRAIENIERNAIRYAPAATSVEVNLSKANNTVSIVVRDYGPGVPSESLSRIFDAFYRVESDRDRSSGGVGLGLSIARRVIALHRGTIHANLASPGLIVSISLPTQA